jgi:hypothetical protein
MPDQFYVKKQISSPEIPDSFSEDIIHRFGNEYSLGPRSVSRVVFAFRERSDIPATGFIYQE